MRVLLVTHVFPRAADDPLGAFLLHLVQAFPNDVETLVVAPHAAGLAVQEHFGAVRVRRFRYAPDAQETLAYTGVMHEQVARSVLGKISFARFLNAYRRAIIMAVRDWKPDVIHAHWWLPGGVVGAYAARRRGVPLVLTTHGTDVEQLRRARWIQPLARGAFAQARVVTCGSTYLRERLVESRAADSARLRVIPMPVNPLFLAALEGGVKPERVSGAPLRILTVARLSRQKSIDTLLDALGILRARGLAARLTVVGDGDQRAALEQRARALNVEPPVEFLGMRPQSELPAHYAGCDVFVLPSQREGLGLALAEALLGGAPVIAARSGGVTDIVRDGETGLLFPERDAGALAAALETYARDPERAARLAVNGRALVLERFTPARVAQQFLEIYAHAIG